MTPTDIIGYWFAAENRDLWFKATAAMDAAVREQFEPTWGAARDGQLDHWQDTPEGCLALAIILDQLPLNMYRGKAKSFSTEAQAREVTRHALQQGFDAELSPQQQAFLYMPLMHSEDIDDQNESVRLFEAAGLEDNLRFARHHRDLIRRFGRFPHRNALLDRESTPEEVEYLASKQAFTG